VNGLFEVGTQVVNILDAHAQPDQAIVDTASGPYIGRDARMRHGRRMTNQRLDSPQALGQTEQRVRVNNRWAAGAPSFN
jgi:hypothetical protein